jgi:translation initiation factor 2B subunit (eIF-2B alpha/beta/delta family)/8-oxo-dGTP pyrophosphatase MutT (NUDIX family)
MATENSAPLPQVERRTVVSVLIFPHQPHSSDASRVLLFRRSDKVRTYQNKLSPIAGSVEADDKNPLAAAWRELKEETSFGPEQLELWRRGLGFEFTDEKAVSGHDTTRPRGRTWKVWPFAFRLKQSVADHDNNVDSLGLNLDWEHTGCEWRTVDEILNGNALHDCVPRLEVTLGQLWISPGSVLHKELDSIHLDHEHGARELATMAIRALLNICDGYQQTHKPEESSTWWDHLQQDAFHLAFNARPSMAAAISSAIATALQAAREIVDNDPANSLPAVKQKLQECIATRDHMIQQVSHEFSKFLKTTTESTQGDTAHSKSLKILTLSSSSTIKAALVHALDVDETLSIELRILESRPLNEGAGFAKTLTQLAVQRQTLQGAGPCFHDRLCIVLASDASVGLLSADVDLVVIGADRISEAGDVSNKTGTLAAVLVSKAVTNGAVKVVCISESEKIAVPGALDEYGMEDNDSQELINGWNIQLSPTWQKMVTVRNVYFEWCPAKYIDYYICEYGTLSTAEIRRKSTLTAELLEKAFSAERF